jgi:hypothetical protein
MSGAMSIRYCVLFDSGHARSNRKIKQNQTTITPETGVDLDVRSWGITGKHLNKNKNVLAQ